MKKLLVGLIVSLCFVFSALPVMAAGNPFSDVKTSDWFYDEVMYAYENKLYAGTSATTFSPNEGMTRAMFVAVLGRMVDIDENYYFGCDFTDVNSSDWFYYSVGWAAKNSIVSGVGNSQFAPNKLVTREQMSTMIANYIGKSGLVLPDSTNAATSFNDIALVSSWAKDGLELMRKSGIIQGDEKGNFNPAATATRAECAAIFERLAKNRLMTQGNLGDIFLTIGDCYFTTNSDGKKVIVVKYTFENKGDKDAVFFHSIDDKAFQNGVELSKHSYVPKYEEGYDDGNDLKTIKKGGVISVHEAYVLNNNSDVTVIAKGDYEKDCFKLNKTFSVQ